MNRQYVAVMAMICGLSTFAQVQTDNNGNYRLHPTNPSTVPQGPKGFTIGNAYVAGQSLLNVRGDLLSGTNQTGEVFRTNAPTTGNTYWRMFQGGTGAANERGQFFAIPGATQTHFNINAPNGHLRLYTNTVERARLNGNLTGPIGPTVPLEFPNINRDGFLVLSGTADAFTNASSRAPFTRLHLVDNAVNPTSPTVYAQQHGFRPWQRNGITFTGNSDQSYIGQKYDANDNTDFVVQWSDNPNGSPWGTDRMKFVFTTQYNPANTRGATSVNGLEAIRLWPQSSTAVNMGIGDFFAGNQVTPATVVDPTERLDILNGRLRIRDLPSDPVTVDSFYVMVVDRTTLTPGNQERGVVKWVPPSTFTGGGGGGGSNCTWEPNNGHAVTAWRPDGSNGTCPEVDNFVGIGTANPTAKLHVTRTETVAGSRAGMVSVLNAPGINNGNSGDLNTAISGNLTGSGFRARGVYGTAFTDGSPTQYLIGCEGSAEGSTNVAETIGFFGNASSPGVAYGVKGSTSGNNPLSRGGYFVGHLEYTGNLFTQSDQNLKENISDLSGALDILSQLQPKRYNFRCSDPQLAHMSLPHGQQIGLIAQDVQEVLPGLVHDSHLGAVYASDGTCTGPAVDYKSLDYISLIPLLIGAVQEMKAQLDACCEADQRTGLPTVRPLQQRH